MKNGIYKCDIKEFIKNFEIIFLKIIDIVIVIVYLG